MSKCLDEFAIVCTYCFVHVYLYTYFFMYVHMCLSLMGSHVSFSYVLYVCSRVYDLVHRSIHIIFACLYRRTSYPSVYSSVHTPVYTCDFVERMWNNHTLYKIINITQSHTLCMQSVYVIPCTWRLCQTEYITVHHVGMRHTYIRAYTHMSSGFTL